MSARNAAHYAEPGSPRRVPRLPAIYNALAWLGEIRTLPFSALEPVGWRDTQLGRDY